MRSVKIVKEEREVEIVEYFCDECKGKTEPIHTCELCGGDFCWKHSYTFQSWDVPLNTTQIGTSYDGDYPNYICRKCWNLGAVYREGIDAIRKIAEDREEELYKHWHRACMPNTKVGE